MATVATIEKKSLNQPDQTQRIGRMEIKAVTVGGFKLERHTADPGWRWSRDVKPVVKTDSCQMNHLLYVLSGRLHVRNDDGREEEFNPGDAGMILPGHDGWTVGNEPVVWLEIVR